MKKSCWNTFCLNIFFLRAMLADMCVNQLLHHRVTMELNFFQLEYVLQYTCEDVGVIIARSNINHPGIIKKIPRYTNS